MENISLKLHDCRIFKRGKGVKGTKVVKTFGIPVPNETGVTKDWSYAPFINLSITRLIEQVKDCIDVNNAILCKALLVGLDASQKSDNVKNETDIELFGNRLFALGLFVNKTEAEKYAGQVIPKIRYALESGYVDSMEDGMDKEILRRTDVVAKLKAAGQWAIEQPKVHAEKAEPVAAVSIPDDVELESIEEDSDEDIEQ